MRPARFHVLGGLALCAALCSCGAPPGPAVAPSLSSFSVDPPWVLVGVPTTVTWSFSFDATPNPAPQCAIDGLGEVTDGTQSSLTLTADATFTLRCSNESGESVKEAQVTVVQPVAPRFASFSANPASVVIGTPTDVTWTWSYGNTPAPAPACSIDQGVGPVTSGATTRVTLSTSTVFTLRCTNAAGTAINQVSIPAVPAPVAPSISTFMATPSTVVPGMPTSVQWSWTYSASPLPAPTCTIDQGVGTVTNATSTTVTLTADTTYTLTCTNSAGTGSQQVTITLAPPTAPAIGTFTASPPFVGSGIPTNIQWNWTYSNSPAPKPSCSIDQGVGTVSNGAMTQVNLTAAQTYTLTCTNTGGSGTAQTTITIAPISSGITNGTFESGTLSGWTSAGTTSVVNGGHSGTSAACAGSTTATVGDSSISQTFTAPAGSVSLSFWYEVVCPDLVEYDWATATLTNHSTNVTTTVLARVCSTTGTWQKVTTPVSPNTTYTLTLISHDDDYAPDPTYTLYDDVKLQ